MTLYFSPTWAQEEKEIKGELYAPIYSMYYPTAKWELTNDNMVFLDNYVVYVAKRPDPPKVIIYLEGHTDDVGDAVYNLELSKKRVEQVADYLKSKGITTEQLNVSYYGKSKPASRRTAISKKIRDIRYNDRRVVVRIQKINA